jgi:hypothetical protein
MKRRPPLPPFTCDHHDRWTDAEVQREPPHKFCAKCRAISISERTGDFFICCKCFNAVPYDRQKRREAQQKKWNDRRRRQDGW